MVDHNHCIPSLEREFLAFSYLLLFTLIKTILETVNWLGFNDCSCPVIPMWDNTLAEKVLSEIQSASVGVEF